MERSGRLGARQKEVLRAMLRLSLERNADRPLLNLKAGEVLGAEIFDELAVPFITLSSNGRPYRKALNRLVKRRYVELTPPKRRQVRRRKYRLTKTGREAAEKIRAEGARMEALRETLRLLRVEGRAQATLDEILQLLWRVSGYKFNGREEFEKYWNKTKLGLTLKKLGIGYARVGKRRVRTYHIEGRPSFALNVRSCGRFAQKLVRQKRSCHLALTSAVSPSSSREMRSQTPSRPPSFLGKGRQT